MSLRYSTTIDSESDQEEKDAFLAGFQTRSDDGSISSFATTRKSARRSWQTLLTATPWLISACLGVWVLVLLRDPRNNAAAFGSYESGFSTGIGTYSSGLQVLSE